MIKKKTATGGASGDELRVPKGMRDLIGKDYHALQGFGEKAAEVALYYGFTPIETPALEYTDLFVRSVGEGTDIVEKELYSLKTRGGDHLALRPEFTAGIMRSYFENGMQAWPQPVLLYSFGPVFRHDKPQRGRYRQFWQFDMEVLGTTKSIADAMIIKLTTLILEESGLSNLKVEINSIGDKECRPIYRRELVNYYRRHLKDICEDCRERFKTNPLRLLDCKNPICQAAKEQAPAPVSYLCVGCKHHFKEVLEYLEMMSVSYEINNNLVRGLDYYTRTVFEISQISTQAKTEAKEGTEKEVVATEPTPAPLAIASGGRYDYLARALGQKRDVPGVGVGIGADRVINAQGENTLNPRVVKKPKIFFIQLSFDAKLKSLAVIEVLRKAKIPLAQSLSKDSLGAQLAIAEKLGVPYTIIFGQKEAIEGTVIVRNMQNRSQETIKIEKLAEYVRTLK